VPAQPPSGVPSARSPPRPLLWAALAVLGGTLAGSSAFLPPDAWALICAALAGCAAGRWSVRRTASEQPVHPRSAGVLALALLASLAGLRAASRPPSDPELLEGRWEPRSSGSGGTLGRIRGGAHTLELPAGSVAAGERVRLLPASDPVAAARGPVARGGWGGTGAVLALRHDEIVRLAPPGAAARALQRAREALSERTWHLEPPAEALAQALLFGDNATLDPELADLFTRTGLRHVLAVSGLHTGLVAFACLAPLAALGARAFAATRRLRARRRVLSRLLRALLVLAYVPLAGGAAPVRRAALALVLFDLAPALPGAGGSRAGRSPDALSLWSTALLVECLADSRAPQALSLQLSYLATLGLILGTRPLSQRLRALAQLLVARPALAGQPAGPSVLLRRLARASATAIAASVAAVLATMPISWAVFGETCPWGIVATPLCVPLIAWLLATGWLLVLAPGLVPVEVFAAPARALVQFLEAFDVLPWTPAPLPERPGWLVGAATLLVFARLAPRLAVHARPLARAALLAWAALLVPWNAAPAGLELWAMDVGHGTAVVLRGPGVPCAVFDAGSRDRPRVAQEALQPLLARWEVARPWVVLSHPDRDHAAALGWLVERHPPELWAGALPAPLDERLPHTCTRLDLDRGRVLLTGPAPAGLRLELWRGLPEGLGNEGSRTLVASLGSEKVLLCGDAELGGLEAQLGPDGLRGPFRLVLLPHHGSQTPLLGRFLGAVRTVEAWVSSAAEPPVAREIARRGLTLRCTALEGPLGLSIVPPGPETALYGMEIAIPDR
jgi:competence protein ComEC